MQKDIAALGSGCAMSALPPNVLQNYFEGLLAKH
jgi:hypothetical protein